MKDLRSYLADLEAAGEILHIKKEVDVAKNVGGLAWQAENYQGKAAMFENVKGYPGWKVASYLNGSRRRLAIGIGTTPDKFIPYWRQMLQKGLTPTKMVKEAPCQEIVWTGDQVDLSKLPIHTHSDLCAGPYVGGGLGIVKDPETGIRNVSLHRHQVKGKNKMGVMMVEGRHMDLIRRKWDALNKPCPIAIAIGHHGALYLAANWTMSLGVDELDLAGTLLGEPVEMVKCKTIDMEVPAWSEVVIEGLIAPNAREKEGPFAEHTGYARAGSGNNPYLEVTAITMRKDAIFYALQGGRPVSESQILDGMPMEVVLFDRLRDVGSYVDLKDVVALPCAGGSHILVIKMTPNLDGQARLVLMAALAHQYIHTKIAIAVDDDVDPHSEKDLLWSISTRVNPAKDIFIVPDTLGHPLDASLELVTPPGYAPGIRVGSKMGIDATKPPTRLADARDHFTRAMPRGLNEFSLKDFIS
ncbi:MAG TPA: UbiD family decarboxylase [Bacillota bacterium]